MEGKLNKWTNYLFGWQERYFVLKGSVFYYYYKKGEMPKGRFHLSVCQINSNDTDSKLELDTGNNVIYLKAESNEIRSEWVRGIRAAKKEADKSIQQNKLPNNINFSHSANNCIVNQINSLELEQENNNNNNNNNIVEDKLVTKINNLSYTVEKLFTNNEKFAKIIQINNSNTEMNKIYSDYKAYTNSISSQVEELKKSFTRFNRDFVKLSEYFFDCNGNEIGNDAREKNTNNNNMADLVNDNNHIELAKASAFEIKKKKRMSDLNLSVLSNGVLHKDEEIFYGAKEDETQEGELELNLKHETEFDNRISIHTKNGLELELPVITQNINKNLNNSITQIPIQKTILNVVDDKNKNNKFYDPMYRNKRTEPTAIRQKINLNVWSILKGAIGKDLSKFCVPVILNEPISMLQRLCENFQYAPILNRAATEPNQYLRIALIGAFGVGGFGINIYRTLKSFNPLLSETFEYTDNENNFRYYAEQVSHHPPISACYVEGSGYNLSTNSNAITKLRMTGSVEVQLIGRTYVNLENFGELITFTKPNILVKNLIVGKMYLDATGKIVINNTTNGDSCEIELFEKKGDVQGKFSGKVKDSEGVVRLIIEGNWLTHMDAINPITNERETLWNIVKVPGEPEDRYYFTDFALNLNYINDEMEGNLPPSDSRLRPDQRALEAQNFDLATSEKHRLEEKQRATRKEMEKNKIKHKPIYFEETYDDLTGELMYAYKGGYFEDRKKKDFSKFSDIY